jgi:hypothetical protein
MRHPAPLRLRSVGLLSGVLVLAGASHAATDGPMSQTPSAALRVLQPIESWAQAGHLPPPLPLAQLAPLASTAGAPLPSLGFAASEIGGPVIKGAPYTAEAVSETVQTLADGNRIVRRSLTRLARDGEGRTRQERIVDGNTRSVFINDVVAGRSVMLDPERRRVRELHGSRSRGTDELAWADEMRDWAQDFVGRFRAESIGGADAVRKARIQVLRNVDGAAAREVEIETVIAEPPTPPRVRGAAPPAPPAPPVPPMPPPPMVLAPMGEGVSSPLGTREFDGVRADGTRTTWSIPAGRIGNEKPIEIFSERWYAPELLLVVSTRRSDPRSGETTYRLTNLKRGEPDAALFQVPADYETRGGERRERK